MSSPTSQQQTPDEVASYWTKERMRDAKPMQKTVTDGTRSSSSPSTLGQTTPSGASEQSAPTKKRSTKKSASQTDGPVARSPDTSDNASDYWTQDKMDSAQPMERTVSDGSVSGGPSSPPGGSVTSGTP